MRLALWLGAVVLGMPTVLEAESEKKTSPAIGTWQLAADWGKGDGKKDGKTFLTINEDLTGTIRESQDWISELKDLNVKGRTVGFRYFFGGKQEYPIQFEGTVAGEKLKGTFKGFGATAVVTGEKLTATEAQALAEQPSLIDLYEARTFTDSRGETLPYRLFVPSEVKTETKWPLVLFHHGGGGAGSDNRQQLEGACAREWVLPEAQKANPCVIVAPQIPGKKKGGGEKKGAKSGDPSAIDQMKAHIRTIHELLDHLEKEFPIDRTREYVTGLSFGGECTWLSLMEEPGRFAAAVPVCAGNRLMDMEVAVRGRSFSRFPLWIFHGSADKVISVEASREIVKALREAGGSPKYTEYPDVGHNCWDQAYRDPELIRWVFAQQRKPTDEDKP
ncbi:MAG: dienelactone hydrolase family protein [Verrucomicrobiota bacterium]